MSWTEERVEQLKKLWLDGLSASQIAGELGGVTRNAVIGKVHRLGLSGRAKSTSHSTIARQKRPTRNIFNQKPQRPAQRTLSNGQMRISGSAERSPSANSLVALVQPVSLMLALTDLTERTCKWPEGDPQSEDFHFCGHDAGDATPYCAFHASLAYQPVADRRRRQDTTY